MKNRQLTKWDPFRNIDNFFDNDSLFAAFPFPKVNWDLAMDSYEENGNLIVKMNLPGVNKNELEVSLENDTLTILGRRNEEKEVEKKDYYSKEIKRGSFARSLALPKSVDATKLAAQFQNGELVVTMPIIEKAKDGGVIIPITD